MTGKGEKARKNRGFPYAKTVGMWYNNTLLQRGGTGRSLSAER